MKRFLTFVGLVLALVLPSRAIAGTPYSINWLFTAENPDCHTAKIVEGTAFFDLNGVPLPTYSVPGAFTILPNGFESNLAEAGFDSVLLRMGANKFGFAVHTLGNKDWCTKSNNVVNLVSVPLGIEKPLFVVRRDGKAFSGSTQLDLKLEEINPQLAKDIVYFEEQIAYARKVLIEKADEIADLDVRLDALQQLETEIGDLLTRPLDEITADELDEILKRYSSIIDDATREALKQVLDDLKKSIADLQTELASLMSNFGDQANAISDFLTGDARQSGFGPDDPSNYGLGPNDVPWVDVPDISGVPDAFEAGNDPYGDFADGVIAALDDNVAGGKVVGRANFVAIVRAWRSNQAALEKAILARMSVSQAETNAFLNAQNKVTTYLQQFMDGSGWFHDANVPPDVRANVDGVLKNLYGTLAEELKDRLNELADSWAPEVSNPFFDTVRAFAAGAEAVGGAIEKGAEVMQTIVHATTRIGIGVVPFVGTALDLCEAVSGHEWCLPSGRKLTTGERVWSGLGFGIGKLVKVWKGVSSAAISAEGKLVAAGIVTLGDELGKLARVRQLSSWRGLKVPKHVDIDELYDLKNTYERDVVRRLLADEGHEMLAPSDKVARQILNISKSTTGSSLACDFITVVENERLVLSEVKGPLGGVVDVEHAVLQLKSVVNALNLKTIAEGKTLAHTIERVQIFVPKHGNLGGYVAKAGQLFLKDNPVTLKNQGFPGLIVQVVEL